MKIELQIQIDALKMLFTQKDDNPAYDDSNEGCVYLTTSGFWAVRIPEEDFWLDKSKLQPASLTRFLKESISYAKEVHLKRFDTDKNLKPTLAVLSNDTCETTINAKTLKLLSKDGCKLYTKGSNAVIYFMLDDEVYAFCMPCYRK